MGEWEIIVEDGDLEVVFEKTRRKKEIKDRRLFKFPWGRKSKETEKQEVRQKSVEGILLRPAILKSMEIRAQSIFRPGHEDVEILYALSGDSRMVDMMHQFSSEDILYGSDSMEANVSVANIIEHVKAEIGGLPKVLVILHTHPGGESIPSQQDKLFFSSTEQTIKQHSPGTRVFFGIHAVSGGSVRAKTDYEKINKNTIKWSSITHDHEVAFYTKEAKPLEANII